MNTEAPPSDVMAKSTDSIGSEARLDGVAVAFSGLCAIHCLLAPVLLSVSPLLADSVLVSEHAHRWLLLFIVPVSVLALHSGFRRHQDYRTLALAAVGLFLLAVSAIAGVEVLGDLAERALTTAGGAILALAHLRNYRCIKALARHAGA